MLADMVITGFHGAEMADVKLGDSVVVIGIGPVGLMAVAGANLMGASHIFNTTAYSCGSKRLLAMSRKNKP
jgi:threonine dehydrogenase-like Zn-dependent dehydrogenase